jgi:hypothetical protein
VVTIRPTAEFVADFPDDCVEEGDDIIVFGGRGCTEAIGAALRALGYQVAEPQPEDEHGWTLEAWKGRYKCWLQVTDLGEGTYILGTNVVTLRFWSKPTRHAEFLSDLDAAMRGDARFRQMKWFANYRDRNEVPFDKPVG